MVNSSFRKYQAQAAAAAEKLPWLDRNRLNVAWVRAQTGGLPRWCGVMRRAAL
jgi:hypothetical protein